jgi:alpha,alpha-trehalase
MLQGNGLVYIEDLEELFVDIQTKKILADQKTFVDSEPRHSIKAILNCYREEKNKTGFSLKEFFETHFKCPASDEPGLNGILNGAPEEYMNNLWDGLTRYPTETKGTLIRLPEKFIVPGGRFREIFYWDSYFTIDLIENMVDNFAWLIDHFGFIPNGNRTYFLSRSQPPFFSSMIELLSEEKGSAVLTKYLPQLEKEYGFWMKDDDRLTKENNREKHVVRMPDGEILNRYWDSLNSPRPEGYMTDLATAKKAGHAHIEIFRDLRAGAESGWDFSSRWMGDGKNLSTIRTTKIVPIDLNCLLLHLERSLESGYRMLNYENNAEKYRGKAAQREAAIQKYLWDGADNMFFDYDLENSKPTRAATISMVYPLVSKIATHKQVANIIVQLTGKFLQPGGLLSTLVESGEQWDAPNGWAPMQWMAYKGLMNYGSAGLAEKISRNWNTNVETVFKEKGKITEKYNVVDMLNNAGGGEYPNQLGFGWTNGVYLKFKSLMRSK